MHEIITLQLGQQSNYVAAHFWNTQESYFTYSENEEALVNHDIHWRSGIGADGTETFMPRTVIYDLKGGFGSMRRVNALYMDAEEQEGKTPRALWNGPTTIHTSPPIAPSPYTTSLEAGAASPVLPTPSTVRFWSDFSRVYYHPRSVVPISEYELGSALVPFERFATGDELFADLDREHDLLDRDLRPFVEEADQIQGIQVFTGTDDAWGGFAARYLERLRDEYGKSPVWVWAGEGEGRGLPREKRLIRLANKARTLVEAYKQASIVVPLSLPQELSRRVVLEGTSSWHTSALLSSAIESATLPIRLKDPPNHDTLGGMADILNAMGKQTIAGLAMTVSPARDPEAPSKPREEGRTPRLTEEELSKGVSLDIQFTPSDQIDAYPSRRNGFSNKARKVFSQLVALRGYPQVDGDNNAGDTDMDQDEWNSQMRQNAYEPITRSYDSQLRFPLLDSFPQIFRKTENNEALTGNVNITTSLSTDSSVSDRLKLLRTMAVRSIGLEDREMIGNDLAEMADEYHEGWSSGSDEGDDD